LELEGYHAFICARYRCILLGRTVNIYYLYLEFILVKEMRMDIKLASVVALK
jgi:hypothetical protein